MQRFQALTEAAKASPATTPSGYDRWAGSTCTEGFTARPRTEFQFATQWHLTGSVFRDRGSFLRYIKCSIALLAPELRAEVKCLSAVSSSCGANNLLTIRVLQ